MLRKWRKPPATADKVEKRVTCKAQKGELCDGWRVNARSDVNPDAQDAFKQFDGD